MPYTRPTTDIAKEGLFNILANNLNFSELKTLDLFGGTGSISYELASRGARELTIVEKDPAMFAFIQKNILNLGIENITPVKMEVFSFLNQVKEQYNFIFAGPPYALKNIEEIPETVYNNNLLTEEGWLVLEHTPRNNFKNHPWFRAERNYGTTVFSIFINREANE